jgi:hypothetical protein
MLFYPCLLDSMALRHNLWMRTVASEWLRYPEKVETLVKQTHFIIISRFPRILAHVSCFSHFQAILHAVEGHWHLCRVWYIVQLCESCVPPRDLLASGIIIQDDKNVDLEKFSDGTFNRDMLPDVRCTSPRHLINMYIRFRLFPDLFSITPSVAWLHRNSRCVS